MTAALQRCSGQCWAGMYLLYFHINLVSTSSGTGPRCTISTSARHHATISHHYRIRPMLARPNTHLHHSYTHSPRHPYLCLYSVILCVSVWGHSQMTSALFGVSDTPWCLCQPIISFWHAPWCLKLMTSFVNSQEPKTIIFRIQFISIRVNRICVTKGVQLSVV